MDPSQLPERELRALAAIGGYVAFGPCARGERDELVAILTEKGLVGGCMLTSEGEALLNRLHHKLLLVRAEDRTTFEQKYFTSKSARTRREWDELERQLPSGPPPPRAEWN